LAIDFSHQRHKVRRNECPLWVKSGHLCCNGPCLLYPRKRTCAVQLGMSPYGPKADIDELRGPLGERFGLRQELSPIPSIAGLVPSLVGLPTLPCVSRDILVAHADR